MQLIMSMKHVLLVLCAIFYLANGQNAVQIQVTTPINLSKDDLVITCSATGSLQSITSYSIVRNSTTETEKTVVSNQYDVVNQQQSTTWVDFSLQTRANLTGVSMPSPSATMVLTIPKNQVRCPQDAVGYQCIFIANPNTPNDPITTETDYRYVDIQVDPSTMEPMTIGAQYNGQNVPTQDSTGRHIFSVGTTLTFSCTGMIGNPQRVPRWCYKKTADFNWLAPAFGVTNRPATMVGCNYRMTTTLEYNVTAGDDSVMFMCESGSNNLCGFGDINSNKTIFLTQTTNPGGQSEGDSGSGSNAGLIAGVIIGVLAALILILVLVWFFVFRDKTQGQSYKTKETDTGHNGMPENPREGPVYSVPHKDKSERGGRRNRGDRYVAENPALDVPHEEKSRYMNNDGGQFNRGMYDSQDDIKTRVPYEEDVRRSMQDLPMGSAV